MVYHLFEVSQIRMVYCKASDEKELLQMHSKLASQMCITLWRAKWSHLFGTTAALPSLLRFTARLPTHSFALLPLRAKDPTKLLSKVSVGLVYPSPPSLIPILTSVLIADRCTRMARHLLQNYSRNITR